MSEELPPPYLPQVKHPGNPPEYNPDHDGQPEPVGYQAQAYVPGGYPLQQTVITSSNIRAVYEFRYYQFIPILHIAPAVIGLVFNIIGCGLGSMIAAFCIFCGGHTYLTTQSKGLVCFLCFGAGLLQMGLVMVSAFGWIWAVVWGIHFVSASKRYYGHQIDPTQPQTIQTTAVITA